MKDTANGKSRFASGGYTRFIRFWGEHYDDLAEAIRIIAYQAPQVRFHSNDGGPPQLDLEKLLKLLEDTVGEEVVHLLIAQPEEAAKDSELCRAAAAKLWEVADATPPRGLVALMQKRRNAPDLADFWARWDRTIAERRARLAPPAGNP